MNHNEYMKEWNKKHPDYYKQYKHDYYLKNRKKLDEQNKQWQKDNPEKHNAANSKFKKTTKGKQVTKRERKNHSIEIAARSKINYLIKKNYIQRDICAICGTNETEAHHENYDDHLLLFGYAKNIIWG